MSDYIPEEVWPNVLKFLPVKPLLRCTAVCKTWRSIITSSAFISAHLATFRRRRPLLLTTTNDPLSFSLHSNLADPFPLSRDLPSPFPSNGSGVFFRPFAAVHGLLCLSREFVSYISDVIVWNPSTHKSVHLPKPNFRYETIGAHHFALGFGFDSSKNDYKVVRVSYRQRRDFDDLIQMPPFVEVCSLRERSWRRISVPHLDFVTTMLDWSQCFIHGAVHWVAFKLKGSENVILMFDLGTEVFKKMKLPQCLADVFPSRLSVSLIGGLLAVLDREEDEDGAVMPSVGGDGNGKPPAKVNIWVKKGYGKGGAWTKIFTVDEKWQLGLALHLCRIGAQVSMESSGDEQEHDSKDLHLTTASNVFNFNPNPFLAFTFPESLVLLDKENGKDAYQVSSDEHWIQSYPEGEECLARGLSDEWLAIHAIMTTRYSR